MVAHGVGPKEGPEGAGEKKVKKSVNADSFKKIMRVGEVREVDPEEKRKRKSRYEIEADAASMAQGMVPGQLTPKVEPETEDTFKINVSKLAETAPSTAATPEEYTEEEVPSEQAPAAPSLPPEGYVPEMGEEAGVTPAQKEPPPPSEQEKAKKAKKKAAPEKVVKPALKKVKLEPPLKAAPKPVKETPKEEAFPEKLLGMPAKEKEKVEEEAETLETAPSPPLPTGSWESVKEKSENKEIEAAAAPSIVPMEIAPIVYEVPTPSFAPLFTPFAAFPQMWDLFDRMVGVMTVMTDSGITETTINLTSEQFKASPFYGTQIIVREFSTAPKVFNIEMLVPTQVAGQIQANYNELVAAFEAGKYNFKVNRLEWRELPARKEEKKGKVTRIKKKKE